MNTSKRLARSANNRQIAGVCAGLANYFGLDPTLVRVGYALLTLFTAFAGFLVYLLMWIIVPKEEQHHD